MKDLSKLYEDSKLKLFQQNLLFFGLTIVKYKWYAHKMEPFIEGYVAFDIDKEDITIDKCIHLNYDIITKEDYNHNNLTDLLIHEVMHVLHRHGSRGRNKHKVAWNFATDHVIDRTIKKWDLTKPYHKWNIIPELNKHLPECTEEEAYEWLIKNQKFYTLKLIPGKDGEPDKGELVDQNGNVVQVTIIRPDPANQNEQQLVDNEVDNLISEARATHQTMKDRGFSSNGIIEYLNNILKVEIPWETLLRKAIKTNVIMRPTDRAWHRPNKFLRPLNIYIPGNAMEEDKDGIGTLVIHVDSSGSMSNKDLKKSAHVIMESINYFAKIIVLVADIKIHQIKEFEKYDFSAFYTFLKEGFKGRGGTSHKHIFDWCQNNIYKENPDLFSMFISFTDACSDIEQYIPTYEWCKKIPSIYLTQENGHKLNFDNYEKLEQIFIK